MCNTRAMSKRVFVSLGSNIADRNKHLKLARKEIGLLYGTSIRSCSSIMETSPVGIESQREYLNQIIVIETDLDPKVLLRSFKEIERALGRRQRSKWTEREIDIDIIIYEGVVTGSPELCIPHMEFQNRLFILKGCFELDPDYMVDGCNLSVRELYLRNKDRLKHQEVKTIKSQSRTFSAFPE